MDRLRFYPPGRRCEHPPCITVLNHCNPGPYCLLHAQAVGSIPLVEFGHESYSRLWVAIQLTKRGMNGGKAATAAIE